MKRLYSGESDNSRQFWGRVKALKNKSRHDTAYMLGVVLQELESRVLNFLESAEEVQRRQPKEPAMQSKGASDWSAARVRIGGVGDETSR